jgi:SAM-dependent methyltransferase
VADLPFQLAGPLADRLAAVVDVEGKLVRALDSLGTLAGRDVVLLDTSAGGLAGRLEAAGIAAAGVPLTTPLRLDLPDASADAVLSLWSAFRGVDPADVAEVDRILRPDGRLLVVHDYGRDDVSALRDADAPEYRVWSRREGPFLRDGGFRIRVVHCFWTFDTLEDAVAFLGDAFGERGAALADRLRRPRLSWNVAVYHRPRGGVPAGAPGSARAEGRGRLAARSPAPFA